MAQANENIRHEPNEIPPPLVTLGAGVQGAAVMVSRIVFTVVIAARVADQPSGYISWIVFAALLISGITTVLQAIRVGRVGAGHVLIMGSSGAFISVCVAALLEAGPATMASLVLVSSLLNFTLASRLPMLRRIFTPVVSGSVMMLISASIFPVMFDAFTEVPDNVPTAAAAAAVAATLLSVIVLQLRAPPSWRIWSPLLGIGVGCVVFAAFGSYEVNLISDAPWLGVPLGSWPGLDYTPGTQFWALLPAFLIVTMVGSIDTIGAGVAIQAVSRRRSRATDFRVVQGAINADGVGNLLSGFAGTLPTTTYSTSVSLAEITGIGARRVGLAIGLIFATVAFLPKVTALLIAIPTPVAAAYMTLLLGMLFVQGIRIIANDGLDHRKAAVVGLSFWIGTGLQNGWIFPDLLGGGFLGALLGNGVTSGALLAVIMVLFLESTSLRSKRLTIALDVREVPKLTEFLNGIASKANWDTASRGRLVLVGEEVLANLLSDDLDSEETVEQRRLTISARIREGMAELEFVSGASAENLEDHLAYTLETPDLLDTREISYRLLRHYASTLRHRKYHGLDIVTVHVQVPE